MAVLTTPKPWFATTTAAAPFGSGLAICCHSGRVQLPSPAQMGTQCRRTTVAADEASRSPGWPAHAWSTAIASLFAMMGQTASTPAASVRLFVSVSGIESTHQIAKCVRDSV